MLLYIVQCSELKKVKKQIWSIRANARFIRRCFGNPLMSIGIFCMMCCTISSCGADEQTEPTIDADLLPFFQIFSEEASLRGRNINVLDSSLIASISTDLPLRIIGQCQRNTLLPNEIKISKASWNTYNHIQKEYVVFHELGHCILARSHRDDRDNRGNCLSIMESGQSGCRNVYGNTNRTAYLDELFSN